jgi:hypothetical protein
MPKQSESNAIVFSRVIELIYFIHRHSKLSLFKRRPDIGPHFAEDLAHFFNRTGTERHPDVVDAAGGVPIKVKVTVPSAETADVHDATRDLCHSKILVGDRAGYLVDDKTDPFSICHLEYLIHPLGVV